MGLARKWKTVLFIHGNSACKETFSKQFEGELAKKYRFIAIDLLGHGNSDRAKNPVTTYSVEGHASVVMEVMKKLGLDKPIIVGWSLGGHVGLNLIQRCQKLAGILITGTPPIKISMEGFQQGFQFHPELADLFGKVDFSKEDATKFMKAGGFDTDAYPFIVNAALKTDGCARKYLIEADLNGVGGDQKELVETDDTPLCVVQGENDTNIKNSYILHEVAYKNLFEQVYVIKDAGHAVFWDQPKEFNNVLALFLSKIYA